MADYSRRPGLLKRLSGVADIRPVGIHRVSARPGPARAGAEGNLPELPAPGRHAQEPSLTLLGAKLPEKRVAAGGPGRDIPPDGMAALEPGTPVVATSPRRMRRVIALGAAGAGDGGHDRAVRPVVSRGFSSCMMHKCAVGCLWVPGP
jgi:hypothetical protein